MEFVSNFNACNCYGNWDNVQHFSLVDATTGTKFSISHWCDNWDKFNTSHWCDNWDKVQHMSLVRQLGQSSTHLIGATTGTKFSTSHWCDNLDKFNTSHWCDNWDTVQHLIGGCDNWDKEYQISLVDATSGTKFDVSH